MANTSYPDRADPIVRQLLHLAQQAMRKGESESAEKLCRIVLTHEPGNAGAASYVIRRALEAGDPGGARDIASQALRSATTAELQFLHGQALEALNDRPAARDAYAKAHALSPDQFLALFCQGAQEEALGMASSYVYTYHRALTLAQQAGALNAGRRLSPDVRRRITHAIDVLARARMQSVQEALEPVVAQHGAVAIARVQQAVETCIRGGDTPWAHPLQRPTFMLIPGLEPRPWFEREEFPFLAALEQQTAAIRTELIEVLADEAQLSPYVDMPADAPAAPLWRELNRSARWSSFHLYRHGERNDAHCARCPRTVAALEATEIMRVPEHSPEALFSLLKAGTHIPPHTGVINGRLTVHLPLIVPQNCGALKAGDEARPWSEGNCLIFDDSFVHEAWNHSAEDRAVLIFDIWDPRLSKAERDATSAAVAAIGRFNRTYTAGKASHDEH